MDIKLLQVNDSSYIEGTICLVNGARGMVFRAWAHERCHKTRNGWYLGLVGPISSIVFFFGFTFFFFNNVHMDYNT